MLAVSVARAGDLFGLLFGPVAIGALHLPTLTGGVATGSTGRDRRGSGTVYGSVAVIFSAFDGVARCRATQNYDC